MNNLMGSCVIAIFVACVYGMAYVHGHSAASGQLKQQAIERGFAEYDAKTGKWRWKGE